MKDAKIKVTITYADGEKEEFTVKNYSFQITSYKRPDTFLLGLIRKGLRKSNLFK